jgi:similar to stage IV sporulation protein
VRQELPYHLKGRVEMEIVGDQLEAVLNDAVRAGLDVRRIRRTSPSSATVVVDLPTFFALPAILKRRKCKLRVRRRSGLPFLLRRAGRRLFFAAGFAGFVFGICMLGQVIWSVDVTGNERIEEGRVLGAAAEAGIRPLQWKFRLAEPRELSRRLMAALPGTAWIGVDVQGTRVFIRVVEQTLPEKPERKSPRHLVAAFDAVVTRIVADRGNPAVRPNDRVKRGDVLISGLVGTPERSEAVVAEGNVKGLVWHEYDIVSPLVHRHKVYTGERKTRRYVTIGNRALQISGFGEPAFRFYETVTEQKVIAWRNRKLPFGYVREELREAEVAEETVEIGEAREIGLTQARGEVLRRAGKDAVITAENILHDKVEGGKVYMKVLFEVEQNIATERLIIQGD